MYAYITLDIETVPDQRPHVSDYIREQIEKEKQSIKAPGNYTKPETIAAYIEAERAKLDESFGDRLARCSLRGETAQIICIGWAGDDETVQTIYGHDERELLAGWIERLSSVGPSRPVIVGHNVAEFDLRILWQRSVIHGLRLPSWLPVKAKPWDATVFDTMTQWNPSSQARISCDALCRTLGIQSPKRAGMDGSKVWQAYQEGRLQEIAEYCARDVEAERAIYKRMVGALSLAVAA